MATLDACQVRVGEAVGDAAELKRLWSALDYNGNGIVSLAETVKFFQQEMPALAHQRPLLRAFKYTTLVDGDGDELYDKFEQLDKDGDHRLSLIEFKAACAAAQLDISPAEAEAQFALADVNGGGEILFDEFCRFAAICRMPVGNQVRSEFTLASTKMAVKEQKKAGQSTGYDNQPDIHTRKFRKVEKEFQAVIADPKRLHAVWRCLDYDGNLIVSLAELDKFVVERYPVLNNKRALMRAYKATTLLDGDGDEWIEAPELPALLRNIVYFNKLSVAFDKIDKDHDHRIDFGEFQAGLAELGLNLPTDEAEQEFESMDSNHGGEVLFDEFCAWAARHACPVDDDVRTTFTEASVEMARKHRSAADASASERARLAREARKRRDAKPKSKYSGVTEQIKRIASKEKSLKLMWRKVDSSADGSVSMRELHRYLSNKFPVLSRKPAMVRAYKHTAGADGSLTFDKFAALLLDLITFHQILDVFEQLDTSGDKQLSQEEFVLGVQRLELNLSSSEAEAAFASRDRDGSGNLSLDEFADFVMSQ